MTDLGLASELDDPPELEDNDQDAESMDEDQDPDAEYAPEDVVLERMRWRKKTPTVSPL
ncbi:MAG: hypothetical protein Ct9H300mP8_00310 [Gammaproteobacteria bacterium]|nr:MAG: hypothetical protein Ct9H300mP8_00310 [Gammaproteobacteria bacterium]